MSGPLWPEPNQHLKRATLYGSSVPQTRQLTRHEDSKAISVLTTNGGRSVMITRTIFHNVVGLVIRDVFGWEREFLSSESRSNTKRRGLLDSSDSWPISLCEGNRAEEKVCNIKLGSYSCKGRP